MAKVINVSNIDHSSVGHGQKVDSTSASRQIEELKQEYVYPFNTVDDYQTHKTEQCQDNNQDTIQSELEEDINNTRNRDFSEPKPRMITVSDERPSDMGNQDTENLNSYLQSEKILHEEKAQARKDLFESIIQNDLANCSLIELLLYPFAIILISFLFIVPFCFLPAHDLVIYPEHWYEHIAHGIYFYGIFTSLFWTYISGLFLNLSYFHQARPFIITSVVATMTIIFLIVFSYLFWTKVLFYQYPIPFFAQTTGSVVIPGCLLVTWFLMPFDLKKNQSVWRRMKFVFCYAISLVGMVGVYQFLLLLTDQFRGPYQPLIGLIFPVTRELAIYIETKIVKRCTYGDEKGSLIVMFYALNVNHSIILCCIIGSLADDMTILFLMGFDFLVNMHLCLRIVWVKSKNQSNSIEVTNLLQELALAELVEFHAPLAFILVTFLAYNSPIGAITGNISNSYWLYQAIDDINETLRKMAVFFLVDFTSSLSSATILWFACKINLWKVFIVLQKEFFKGFTLSLGYILLVVSTGLKMRYDSFDLKEYQNFQQHFQ